MFGRKIMNAQILNYLPHIFTVLAHIFMAVAIYLDASSKHIKEAKKYTIIAIIIPFIAGLIYAAKRNQLERTDDAEEDKSKVKISVILCVLAIAVHFASSGVTLYQNYTDKDSAFYQAIHKNQNAQIVEIVDYTDDII